MQQPFEYYNEDDFNRRFRFNKDSVLYRILPKISEELAKMNERMSTVSRVVFHVRVFEARVENRRLFIDLGKGNGAIGLLVDEPNN